MGATWSLLASASSTLEWSRGASPARGGREDARDRALEAAGDDSSEIWLWKENRELGQQLQGAEGIRRGLILACFVLAFCFIVFRRETLERECVLGLGLFVCVLCMFLCLTSVVTCALVSPPQQPVGDRAAPSVSFVSQLPCLMPTHLLTRITAKEILCHTYRNARNHCHSIF